jgi:hypothetical protein
MPTEIQCRVRNQGSQFQTRVCLRNPLPVSHHHKSKVIANVPLTTIVLLYLITCRFTVHMWVVRMPTEIQCRVQNQGS